MQISLPLLRYLYLKKEKKFFLLIPLCFSGLWTPKDLPGPNLYVFPGPPHHLIPHPNKCAIYKSYKPK